jgi:carboxylesterase type B
VRAWTGVLDAQHFKHDCMQEPNSTKNPGGMFARQNLSEDCLYLNVWTPPNATAASKLPVMFCAQPRRVDLLGAL